MRRRLVGMTECVAVIEEISNPHVVFIGLNVGLFHQHGSHDPLGNHIRSALRRDRMEIPHQFFKIILPLE